MFIMSFIIDIVIIAIIALCIFLGYKKGLTGVIFKIISFVLAIVISFVLYKPVANFIIENTTIDTIIENGIAKNISISEKQENQEISSESSAPEIISKYMSENINKAIKDGSEDIAHVVGKNIAVLIIELASLIILFIVVKLILMIVKIFTNIFTKIPIIKQFDKLGGIIYGALEGLLIIYIAFAIISMSTSMIKNSGFVNDINKSFIGKNMYNNNLVLKIFF